MALLTVLLLVAVMSVLTASMLEDVRFGVRRIANAQEIGQAQWYALGAEELASVQIRRLAARTPSRTLATGGWNGREFAFPVDGGEMRVRIEDGGNCFDLNSVAAGMPGQWRRFEPGVRQLRTLMLATGVGQLEAETVSDALVRWIEAGPAVDAEYDREPIPRRPSGELLAEVSELRAVRGVTSDLYARLRPHLCALPRTNYALGGLGRLSPININTLRPEDAVLVTMITDGLLSPSAARSWIESRPAEGWSNVDALFGHPALVDRGLSATEVFRQVQLQTRFFSMSAVVRYGRAEVAMSSLLEHDAGGGVRLAARRWTGDE
jgi:general secretion pathway protein K